MQYVKDVELGVKNVITEMYTTTKTKGLVPENVDLEKLFLKGKIEQHSFESGYFRININILKQ